MCLKKRKRKAWLQKRADAVLKKRAVWYLSSPVIVPVAQNVKVPVTVVVKTIKKAKQKTRQNAGFSCISYSYTLDTFDAWGPLAPSVTSN